MTWLRFQMTVGTILALSATLATEGLAQRGVGVKGRGQATPYISGTYRALVIGNDKYNDPKGLWKPLKTAVNDARAVADVLKNQYGFGDVRLLLNATRRQMGRAINRITEDSRKNDSVLIYYAGHGYLRESTKEGYWIPVDAEGRDDTTYFRNSTIKTKLAVLSDRAKHVLLVSDSCFSGALLREGNRGINIDQRNERYFRKVAAKKSVQILAAGGLEFVDDNYKGTGHSPFTYFFLQELRTNTSGLLDATELSGAVVRNVANNVQQSPERGVLHGAGHAGGEFFFARVSGGSATPATLARTKPGPATQPRRSIDAEEELWQAIKTSKTAEDYQDYLAAYPKGRFAVIARIQIRRLHRAESRRKNRRKNSRKNRPAKKPASVAVKQLGENPAPPAGMVNIPAGNVRGFPVNSFNMDVFETTNLEFLAFVKDNPHYRKSRMDKTRNDGDYLSRWRGDLGYAGKYANLPVVYVSQIVAKAYCKWKGKRLPSSQEWGLAAGVGKRKYPWGNREPDRTTANFDKGLFGDPMLGIYFAKGATPEGVRHMGGNVWELTSTIVRGKVVARGGSYYDKANVLSNDYSGMLSTDPPVYSSRFMGFRCAS